MLTYALLLLCLRAAVGGDSGSDRDRHVARAISEGQQRHARNL